VKIEVLAGADDVARQALPSSRPMHGRRCCAWPIYFAVSGGRTPWQMLRLAGKHPVEECCMCFRWTNAWPRRWRIRNLTICTKVS